MAAVNWLKKPSIPFVWKSKGLLLQTSLSFKLIFLFGFSLKGYVSPWRSLGEGGALKKSHIWQIDQILMQFFSMALSLFLGYQWKGFQTPQKRHYSFHKMGSHLLEEHMFWECDSAKVSLKAEKFMNSLIQRMKSDQLFRTLCVFKSFCVFFLT